MGEARRQLNWDEFRLLDTENGISSGQVIQLPDGRAAFYEGLNATSSGDDVPFSTSGKVTLPKTTSMVLLAGGRAYWDHSANAVHYKKTNDRDFYIGRVATDASSSDANCDVYLNSDPPYDID